MLADQNGVAFFERAVEKDGDIQDGRSYFDAIKPTLQRKNCIGMCADDPNVMKSCRSMVEHQFPGVVVGPCPNWHKTDNAVPLKVPTVAAVLTNTGTLYNWFRRALRGGLLRKRRQAFNTVERREASAEKRPMRLGPTLKVSACLIFNSLQPTSVFNF